MCICMAESLCCVPETITTLLIGYTPILKKKFKKVWRHSPYTKPPSQRDQVEREVGGGIGMGNTCKSMADSCQCMTKTTTIL